MHHPCTLSRGAALEQSAILHTTFRKRTSGVGHHLSSGLSVLGLTYLRRDGNVQSAKIGRIFPLHRGHESCYLLLASVPIVIAHFVIKLDRLPSISSVHIEVFQWAFAYLLANMFVSIISGSISRSLEDLVDNPKLVLSFLADSFPQTSVLFCNYVISVTLVAGPNELLQILPLLQFAYYTRLDLYVKTAMLLHVF